MTIFGTTRVLKPVLFLLLGSAFSAPSAIAAKDSPDEMRWRRTLEAKAYHVQGDKVETPQKAEYMRKLSPGGKIYFLACRQDWQQALELLDKFPKNQTGSALYVKGYCLSRLGRAEEAVRAYEEASSKVSLIFDPGFKFYLHYGHALINAGRQADGLKQFAVADGKRDKAAKYGYKPQAITNSVNRRKYALLEKNKNYEEAFRGYASLINNLVNELEKPIVFSAEEKAKAKAVLAEKRQLPPADHMNDLAGFYLERGIANQALDQKGEAIKNYQAVMAIKPWFRAQKELVKISENSEFVKGMQIAANNALLKMYFQAKDYANCCKAVRQHFEYHGSDPAQEFTRRYASISIKDVPELVLQKDVVLHNPYTEIFLDAQPFRTGPPPVRTKIRKFFNDDLYNPYRDDRLLAQARKQAGKREFKNCYNTLEMFIRENAQLAEEHQGAKEGVKAALFLKDHLFRARLYQLAVGYAAGKTRQALSFSTYAKPLYRHPWKRIEHRLLGKISSDTSQEKHKLLEMDNWVEWCHFAAAVHAMSKSDWPSAGRDFGAIKTNRGDKRTDEDLILYSRVLKEFCDGRALVTDKK